MLVVLGIKKLFLISPLKFLAGHGRSVWQFIRLTLLLALKRRQCQLMFIAHEKGKSFFVAVPKVNGDASAYVPFDTCSLT